MELLHHDQLKALTAPTPGPCVSIFIPTHRGGPEVKQGAIRLKNQLRGAERQLAEQGLRNAEIQRLLEPAQQLCDQTLSRYLIGLFDHLFGRPVIHRVSVIGRLRLGLCGPLELDKLGKLTQELDIDSFRLACQHLLTTLGDLDNATAWAL